LVDELVIATSVLAGFTGLLVIATVVYSKYVREQVRIAKSQVEVAKLQVEETRSQLKAMRLDHYIRLFAIAIEDMVEQHRADLNHKGNVENQLKVMGFDMEKIKKGLEDERV